MAVSIDWGTKVVSVPKADLTLVSGTLYELDTDAFRTEVKALETSVEGMPELDVIKHTGETTIAGATYARFVEIINGYTIEFESGLYSVRLSGSNNNLFDLGILVLNGVGVIGQNSAGLIRVDESQIAAQVWAHVIEAGLTAGDVIDLIAAATVGEAAGMEGTTVTFKGLDDLTVRITATTDSFGNRLSVTKNPA